VFYETFGLFTYAFQAGADVSSLCIGVMRESTGADEPLKQQEG